VLSLLDRFPGAELAFDAFSPFQVRVHNRKVDRTGIGARLQWALKNGRDLERWPPSAPPGTDGIRLLEEFFPFQYPDRRIRRFPIVLVLPLIAKAVGVFHYRLGGGKS
jgi:hypothetical protein